MSLFVWMSDGFDQLAEDLKFHNAGRAAFFFHCFEAHHHLSLPEFTFPVEASGDPGIFTMLRLLKLPETPNVCSLLVLHNVGME